MDDILLKYYNQELRYIRELGGEFAKEYPKIAGRLGIDSYNCADPFVERLLEGFSFLTARVNYQIDTSVPKVAESILSVVYPDSLTQTPSMFIAKLTPDMEEGTLVNGYNVAQGTLLKSNLGADEVTPCRFTTTSNTTLWPIEITEANYQTRGLGEIGIGKDILNARSMLRIKLHCLAECDFSKLTLDNLRIFLRGAEGLEMFLFELLLSKCSNIWIKGSANNEEWQRVNDPTIKPVGLDKSEALFPSDSYAVQGYRLLREYFSFYQKFMFVEIGNLAPTIKKTAGNEIEIVFLFDTAFPELGKNISESNFELFAVPVINLFKHRCDMIVLEDTTSEYKIIPDRTRAIDYEVYDILKVTGFDSSMSNKKEFKSFYSNSGSGEQNNNTEDAYYTMHRKDRMLTDMENLYGCNTNYIGSDVFLSFVDAARDSYFSNMHYVSLEVLCSNRGLPVQMARSFSLANFTLEEGMPIKKISCIHGPTLPLPANSGNILSDKMLSFLSLNYFSLSNNEGQQAVKSLRSMLQLYCRDNTSNIAKHIEGITDLKTKPIVRRVPGDLFGNMARGIEVEVIFDELNYQGTGCFLLGLILAEFFTQYVSINSFTETIISTEQRGELIRWETIPGKRVLF